VIKDRTIMAIDSSIMFAGRQSWQSERRKLPGKNK